MKRHLVWYLAALAFILQTALTATAVQSDSMMCDAALIIINLDQITVSFAGTGDPFPRDWRTADDHHVIAANAELIPAARDAGMLIIYLYGTYAYLREGEELATFAQGIAPQDGDILIGRPGGNLSVFLDTILLETLESRGMHTLVFSGLNTAYCIHSSARYGVRFGFDVTVVADAHSGGGPAIAQSYNGYWPSLGISVVSMADLDFAALCSTSETPEDGNKDSS